MRKINDLLSKRKSVDGANELTMGTFPPLHRDGSARKELPLTRKTIQIARG
jgi:hypothetical protein